MIMKKQILYVVLMFLAPVVSAQNTKNLKVIDNSAALYQKGLQLADQGNLDEAFKAYSSIPFGDPNYHVAQYEMAYCYILKEEYSSALSILENLAKNPANNVNMVSVFTEMGNCYDYLGQVDKALAMYDKCIETNPYNYHAHFNKGVALLRADKVEEAMACFKRSIFLSPAHQGSHFQYAKCCLLMGYTIPGIAALNYTTMINPSSQYAIFALQTLDDIYENGIAAFNSDNDISVSSEYKEKNKFYDDVCMKLNLAIMSPKSVKAPTKVNHNVAKFNYVVLSNLKARPNSHEIEDQLYIPFFEKIFADKKYNDLCFYQFSGTDINGGKVAEKAEKMAKSLEVLIVDIVAHLNAVIEKGIGLPPSDTTYVYERFDLDSWGVLEKNASGKNTYEGTWYALNDNGQISYIGQYKNGERNGIVKTFYNNRLHEELTYKNGLRNGLCRGYSSTPCSDQVMVQYSNTQKNDQITGPYQEYNHGGVLIYEANFINNIQDGEVRSYDDCGYLSKVETYTDQEWKGPQKYYYANGQLKSEYVVGEQDEKTPYTSYYINGKVETTGFIKNKTLVGPCTVYYANGSIRQTYTLNDKGNREGEEISYFRNGNISSKANYIDGKDDGEINEYDFSGKRMVTSLFKNGTLISVTTYNPDGSVRETIPVKNKNVTFDLYDENGRLHRTITRDAKNNLQGLYKEFYADGSIGMEANYKDDLLDGICKTYYHDGKIAEYAEYKEGMRNGLAITYYDNATHDVKTESYYRNDTLIRAQYSYFPSGSLDDLYTYDEQGNITYYADYLPDGKMVRDIYYNDGLKLITNSYDLDGNIIHCDTTLFGNGHNDVYTLDGKIKISRSIKAGLFDGIRIDYNHNGIAIDTSYLIHSTFNGTVRSYYPTGSLVTKHECIMEQTTHSSSYYPNGQLSVDANHELGPVQGEALSYRPDGKLAAKMSYIASSLEGISYYYAPDGKTVLLQLNCHSNNPFQYAYLQQNGKMSEWEPLGNEAKTVYAYYPNGKTAMVVNFDHGDLHGNCIVYYTNGQAAESKSFSYGHADGTTLYYYPNGKLLYKSTQHDDNMEKGIVEMYYENGQKSYEGHYFYDLPHGDFITYDKNGKMTKKVNLYYGIETSNETF